MSISSAVSDAIQKELPNAVASELQQFIQQAELDKNALDRAKNDLVTLRDENTKFEAENKRLQKLELRKEELDEKERNMKVVLAEFARDHAIKETNTIFNLVDRIFRNPVVTKTLSGNVPVLVPSSNGCQGFTTTQNVSETTSEEVNTK